MYISAHRVTYKLMTLARTATIQGQCVTQITEKKCENTKNCGCTQRLLLYIMPQRISSQYILGQ